MQRPDKTVKLDFYAIHNITSDYFYAVFLKVPWLSHDQKVRLLEWKARANIAIFAALREWRVELRPQDITQYHPRGNWAQLKENQLYSKYPESHAPKTFRGLYLGHEICPPFEDQGQGRMTKDMWLKLATLGQYSSPLPLLPAIPTFDRSKYITNCPFLSFRLRRDTHSRRKIHFWHRLRQGMVRGWSQKNRLGAYSSLICKVVSLWTLYAQA